MSEFAHSAALRDGRVGAVGEQYLGTSVAPANLQVPSGVTRANGAVAIAFGSRRLRARRVASTLWAKAAMWSGVKPSGVHASGAGRPSLSPTSAGRTARAAAAARTASKTSPPRYAARIRTVRPASSCPAAACGSAASKLRSPVRRRHRSAPKIVTRSRLLLAYCCQQPARADRMHSPLICAPCVTTRAGVAARSLRFGARVRRRGELPSWACHAVHGPSSAMAGLVAASHRCALHRSARTQASHRRDLRLTLLVAPRAHPTSPRGSRSPALCGERLRRRPDLRAALSAAHSLKEKRHYVRSAKAHLQNRVGASVAEVDHHDVWQRTA